MSDVFVFHSGCMASLFEMNCHRAASRLCYLRAEHSIKTLLYMYFDAFKCTLSGVFLVSSPAAMT